MAGEKFISTMQKVAAPKIQTLADLVYGEVITTSPLSIKIDNRLTLTEPFILVSSMCESKDISIDVLGDMQMVNLWRGLQVGDVVRMIRLSSGQKYYVMEREGGLTI